MGLDWYIAPVLMKNSLTCGITHPEPRVFKGAYPYHQRETKKLVLIYVKRNSYDHILRICSACPWKRASCPSFRQRSISSSRLSSSI